MTTITIPLTDGRKIPVTGPKGLTREKAAAWVIRNVDDAELDEMAMNGGFPQVKAMEPPSAMIKAAAPFTPSAEWQRSRVTQLEEYLEHPSVRAMLDTIAHAEGADYDVLFGGDRFTDFSNFPGYGRNDTASGRYRF